MKKLVLLILAVIFIMSVAFGVFAESSEYVLSPISARIAVDGKLVKPERELVTINGRILVPARTTFQMLGARIDWYPESECVDIIKDDIKISMKIGEKSASVNGVEKEMEAPAITVLGTVMVPVRFVVESLNTNLKWDAANRIAYIGKEVKITESSRGDDREYTVVIDAGHGGSDPGAAYNGVKEKDLNLDVAKRLYELLKKEDGIKAYMTRTSDVYVGLYDRSGMANQLNADLFISIHHNAGSSKYSGSMALYYPSSDSTQNGVTGEEFASMVEQELTAQLGTKNLGTYARPNLAVLRTTKMPAVIAELGFITNKAECSRIKTSEFKQGAAEALEDAVLEALGIK